MKTATWYHQHPGYACNTCGGLTKQRDSIAGVNIEFVEKFAYDKAIAALRTIYIIEQGKHPHTSAWSTAADVLRELGEF